MSKGEKNGYRCESCGHLHVTIDLDDGTTPMLMSCPKCGGRSVSQFYRIDQSLEAAGCWYKAKIKRTMSSAVKEHIRLGGLMHRMIEVGPINR